MVYLYSDIVKIHHSGQKPSMDLCNESCSSAWSAVLHGKNFNVEDYSQTLHTNLFLPAVLIGTNDFFHCIPFSLTLTLPGGYKVRMKQNLLALFSTTLLILSG